MTSNSPAFVSDEELVKQLQAVLRSVTAVPGGRPSDGQVLEARSLAEELAMRIYNNAERWGISAIPADFRDDVVGDTFTALMFAVDGIRGRQSITQWFADTAEARFHRLWALAESQRSERERVSLAAAANPRHGDEPPEEAAGNPDAFSLPGDLWARFEAEFPRDAFALRLRYLLKQTPEQMATMLDAPSPRAISMRLERARDRFRMFCEQQGLSRGELSDVLAQLSEESRS